MYIVFCIIHESYTYIKNVHIKYKNKGKNHSSTNKINFFYTVHKAK